MANVNIQLGYKDSSWFTANATLILLAGQVVYLQQTGQYKIGDGTTQLQNLVFQGIAQETQLVTATVVNKTGVNLLASNYQAVKVSTAQGQRLAVDFAQANNDNNSADTIGLVKENINVNQEGKVVILGQIVEVNTTGSLQGETWTDGDVLYLSPTTAGRITNVKPTGLTGHIVVIGYVEYAHAIHGKIYTKIMNGWEVMELHDTADVSYTTPIDADSLFIKDSTASLWKRLTWANLKSFFVSKTATETITGLKTFSERVDVGEGIYTYGSSKSAFIGLNTDTVNGNYPGIWFNQNASRTVTNYSFLGDSANCIFNAQTTGTLNFRIANTNKFRVSENGNVIIQNGGTYTDAGYRLDINGTVRIQDVLTVGRLATEPTTNLQNGQIYYNTTTNKFRAYENGAWVNLI